MVRPAHLAAAAAAAVVVLAGTVFVNPSVAPALTDPHPANLTIEGDSWPQNTVQQLQGDAFNDNDLGTLAPKFTAPTTGESAARADFASGQTDMAAVSEPLTAGDLAAAKANGITPGYVAYGLSGVSVIVAISTKAGVPPITSLNLTIPTIAKIMTHQIQSWSAAEIENENPTQVTSLNNVLFPQTPIQVVERRTSSPTTTALIAAFLADPVARPIWDSYATEFGSPVDTPLDIWPDDVVSSASGVTSGEEGVVTDVLDLQAVGPPGPQNAIGYVSPQWAQQFNATQVAVAPSGSPTFVAPNPAGIQAAFAPPGVTFDSTTDLYSIDYTKITGTGTGTGAYPIPMAAYFAVPLTGGYPAKKAAAAGFLKFALSAAGQTDDTTTGMVPLPPAALAAAQSVLSSFVGSPAPMSGDMSSATTSTTVKKASSSASNSSTGADAGSSAGSASGASSSSGLANTGGTLPLRSAAAGMAMVVVGDAVRRRALRRRSRAAS